MWVGTKIALTIPFLTNIFYNLNSKKASRLPLIDCFNVLLFVNLCIYICINIDIHMYIHFKVGTTVHYPFFWQSNSISISSIFDCISLTLCFRVRAHSWAWHPQIIHFRKEGRDNFWPFISITSRSKRRPTGWVSSISVVRSLIFLQDSQLQEEVHLLFFRGFPINFWFWLVSILTLLITHAFRW